MHVGESSRPGGTMENPIIFTMRKSQRPMMGRAMEDVGPEDSVSNVSSRASSTAREAKLRARQAELDALAAAEEAENAVRRAAFEAAQQQEYLRLQQQLQRQEFEAQWRICVRLIIRRCRRTFQMAVENWINGLFAEMNVLQ